MLLCLPLLTALTLGFEPLATHTPWFLPRYAATGGYAGTGVFAPTVRIGWELALVEQRTEFVVLLEFGPAFGALTPPGMKLFWEHTVLGGAGLRNRRGGKFHWGISVLAGPVLHGATFNDSTLNEERWNAVIEGRLEGGVEVGPVALALYLGYQQPWLVNLRFSTASYVGGVAFGFLVNWR